jgi:hypothetical protein
MVYHPVRQSHQLQVSRQVSGAPIMRVLSQELDHLLLQNDLRMRAAFSHSLSNVEGRNASLLNFDVLSR